MTTSLHARARSHWTTALIAVSIASSYMVLVPIDAAASCVPNRAPGYALNLAGNQWFPGGTVGGAGANITEYVPYVYSPSGNVYAWSMILTSNAVDYAQLGWWQRPAGIGRFFFIQFTDQGLINTETFAPYGGSNNRYTVTWEGGTYRTITFWVNGGQFSSTVIHWTPGGGEFYGETNNVKDQMIAGAQTGFNFNNAKVWTGGAWQSIGGNVTNSNTNWYFAGKVTGYLQVYDKACAS